MRGANDAGGAGVQRRTSTRRIQDSEDEDDAKDGVDAMQVDEEEADDSQEAVAARDDLHGSRRVSVSFFPTFILLRLVSFALYPYIWLAGARMRTLRSVWRLGWSGG